MEIDIQSDILTHCKSWFSIYVESFKYGNQDLRKNIILKEEHTYRVVQEIKSLAESLGLQEGEKRFAELTALLHDIGRFEQYARYQTFNDSKSENHADLGITILKRYGILNHLKETTQDFIYRVIQYHNRANLPEHESETCLFFSKLLRDADKLDIWKVVIDHYYREDGQHDPVLELGLPHTSGISEKIYQDLMNHRIAKMENMQNLNDFKLLQMGWVFDINFKPAFQLIKSRHYIEKIRHVLPNSKKVDDINKTIQIFMDHKLIELSKDTD